MVDDNLGFAKDRTISRLTEMQVGAVGPSPAQLLAWMPLHRGQAAFDPTVLANGP